MVLLWSAATRYGCSSCVSHHSACHDSTHPDHVATTRIVEDARFDAKLTKIDLPGEPTYPKWLFYYYCTHLRWVADPNFLIDITGYEDRKRQSIVAYETQFVMPRSTGACGPLKPPRPPRFSA